jgi:hypothetical protein
MSSSASKRKRSPQEAAQKVVITSLEPHNDSITNQDEVISTRPLECAIETFSENSSFDSALLLPEPPYYEKLPEHHPIRHFWDSNYALIITLARPFLEKECNLDRQCDLATLWEENEKGVYLAVFFRDEDIVMEVHKKLEEPLKVLVNHLFGGHVKGPLFWRMVDQHDEQATLEYGNTVESSEEESDTE